MKLILLTISFLTFGCTSQSKQTSVAHTSMESKIERDPAGEIEKASYLGILNVTDGVLKLTNTDDELQEINTGAVKVQLFGPSMLFSPIKHFRGDLYLSLETQNQEFEFRLPAETKTKEGEVHATKQQARQAASVDIKEHLKLVSSNEEEGTASCTYMGMCGTTCTSDAKGNMSCMPSMGACGGTQRARMRVDVYARQLKLVFKNESGTAEVLTSEKKEIDRQVIKQLSSCG